MACLSTVSECQYTSLCWWCSSISSFNCGISGITRAASPVSHMTFTPSMGNSPRISLSSSVRTRSAVIRSICPDISTIASCTRGASVKPSCETKRAARSIRSGSSLNEISGAAGVSRTPARSASIPFNGSTNSNVPVPSTRTAIAFTVKSRRTRSSSSVVPYCTSGYG